MDWLLETLAVWLGLDVLFIATIWYATISLSQLLPNWWQQNIAATIEPSFDEIVEPELKREILRVYSKI
jgi:hypothetical protein